jgi:peptidoglycan/xylan/chitin deacetylase (PgdA/CDA1 family)
MQPDVYLQHESSANIDRHGRVLYGSISDLDIVTSQSADIERRVVYPDKKQFGIVLTHDVDHVYFSIEKKVRYAIRTIGARKWSHIKHLLHTPCSMHNPLLNTQKIIDLENRYGATSTFFVMAATDEDSRYDVADTKELLQFLISHNREVGLHASYTSYTNSEQIKTEKARLEAVLGVPVVGIRQHYLRFNRSTWQAQAAAGFQYDATLGYADRIGFRNGMIRPFVAFDENNQSLPLIAIPLGIMEGTLYARQYMNIPFVPDIETAWQACREVLDEVKRVGGCVSILWHPDQFDDVLHPNSMALYERILQYGAEHDAWMTSGAEVIKYLQENT